MALRLRVLAGRHRGAEFEAAAATLTVGAGDDCDVTLTDPGLEAQAFELIGGADGLLLKPVGSVRVNGAPLVAVTPLRPGDVIDCSGVELALLAPPAPTVQATGDGGNTTAPSASAPIADVPPTAAPSAVRRRRMPVVAAMVAASVLAAAAVGLSVVLRPAPAVSVAPAPPAWDAGELQNRLQAEGFRYLRVQRDYRGNVSLTGLAHDATELRRLETWLADHASQLRSSVQTGTALAEQLAAHLDDPGVRVAYVGEGRLRLDGRPKRDSTSSKIVRWTAELGGAFEIENAVTYQQDEEATVVAGKGRFPLRISQLNAGETPYLETTDGARYFEGSLLADGSVIRSIGAEGVVVESGGRLVQYRMVD